MAHALAQTLELRPVQIIRQDGVVVGVRALLDDDAGALAGREAADVGETLESLLVGLFIPEKKGRVERRV